MHITCTLLVEKGEIDRRLAVRTWRNSWKGIGIAIPHVRNYPFLRKRGTDPAARAHSSAQIVTYSASISTDIPLYEPPGVSYYRQLF
jgi:hypothetical protein